MEKQTLGKKAVLLVVWGAMTASVPIYALMAFILGQSGRPQRGPASPALLSVAQVLSLALPIAALILAVVAYRFLTRLPSPDEALSVDGPMVDSAWVRLRIGVLVMLALFEAVSIAGLLFFFLGAPLALFLRFALANLVLNAFALTRIIQDASRAEELERRLSNPSG